MYSAFIEDDGESGKIVHVSCNPLVAENNTVPSRIYEILVGDVISYVQYLHMLSYMSVNGTHVSSPVSQVPFIGFRNPKAVARRHSGTKRWMDHSVFPYSAGGSTVLMPVDFKHPMYETNGTRRNVDAERELARLGYVFAISKTLSGFVSYLNATRNAYIESHRSRAGHSASEYVTDTYVTVNDSGLSQDIVHIAQNVEPITANLKLNDISIASFVLPSRVAPCSEYTLRRRESEFVRSSNVMASALRGVLRNDALSLRKRQKAAIEDARKSGFNSGVSLYASAIGNGWVTETTGDGRVYFVYPHRVYATKIGYEHSTIELPDRFKGLFYVENIRVPLKAKLDIVTATGFNPHKLDPSRSHDGGYWEQASDNSTRIPKDVCIGTLYGEPVSSLIKLPQSFETIFYPSMFSGLPETILRHILGEGTIRLSTIETAPDELKGYLLEEPIGTDYMNETQNTVFNTGYTRSVA